MSDLRKDIERAVKGGTSEGAKRGWQTRRGGAPVDDTDTDDAWEAAIQRGNEPQGPKRMPKGDGWVSKINPMKVAEMALKRARQSEGIAATSTQDMTDYVMQAHTDLYGAQEATSDWGKKVLANAVNSAVRIAQTQRKLAVAAKPFEAGATGPNADILYLADRADPKINAYVKESKLAFANDDPKMQERAARTIERDAESMREVLSHIQAGDIPAARRTMGRMETLPREALYEMLPMSIRERVGR